MFRSREVTSEQSGTSEHTETGDRIFAPRPMLLHVYIEDRCRTIIEARADGVVFFSLRGRKKAERAFRMMEPSAEDPWLQNLR